MADLQVTIIGPGAMSQENTGSDPGLSAVPHSRTGSGVINRIDDLERIWGEVIIKLTGLAAKSQAAASTSPFELNEIEFNVGIEAGLNVGLVTKADASVSIRFSRRRAGG